MMVVEGSGRFEVLVCLKRVPRYPGTYLGTHIVVDIPKGKPPNSDPQYTYEDGCSHKLMLLVVE